MVSGIYVFTMLLKPNCEIIKLHVRATVLHSVGFTLGQFVTYFYFKIWIVCRKSHVVANHNRENNPKIPTLLPGST